MFFKSHGVAIYLILIIACAGELQAADAVAETAPKRTAQTANVILSRDLISTTKAVEDLGLRLRAAQGLRGEFERSRASLDEVSKGISDDPHKTTDLAVKLKELQTTLTALRAEVKQLEAKRQEKAKADAKKIEEAAKAAADAQPAAAGAAAAPAPPPSDVAPPPPAAAPPAGDAGASAQAPQSAPAPMPPPDANASGSSQVSTTALTNEVRRLAARLADMDDPEVTDLEEKYGNTWMEMDLLRQQDRSELQAIDELDSEVSNIESQVRMVEIGLGALEMPVLSVGSQGGSSFVPVLSAGFGTLGTADGRFSSRNESAPTAPPQDDLPPAKINSLPQLRWALQNFSYALAHAETRLAETGQRRTKVLGRLDALKQRMASLEGKSAALTATLKAELKSETERKQLAEDTLSLRDEKYNQHQVNLYLVWAVLIMGLAIPALFLMFRFYQPHVIALLVNERIFIEILSMAFLLLAIIILGTGSIITGEGLAGLLGTIAGYIFARKAAESIEGRQSSQALGGYLKQSIDEGEQDLEGLKNRLDTLKGQHDAVKPLVEKNQAIEALQTRSAATPVTGRAPLEARLQTLVAERDALQQTLAASPETATLAAGSKFQELQRELTKAQADFEKAQKQLEVLKAIALKRRQT